MKKTTLLMLAICASAPMFAESAGTIQLSKDSSVTFYGTLDAGVAEVSHSLNFDSDHPVAINPTATKTGNTSATGMFNGGISQSRIGVKGDTVLPCGDWKALFLLESAINVPSGNVSNAALSMAQNKSAGPNMSADSAISGQLFARGAYFGVSSATYGTLTLGRHTSFMLDVVPGYDALQGAQLFTPIGFSGSYGGGGATDDSREDNSVKYRVKVGDFNFGFLHKFGGVSGASSAQSANQLIFGYEKKLSDTQSFGIQAIYQANTDAFSVSNPADTAATVTVTTPTGTTVISTIAQPLGTLALTAEDTKSYMVVGRYTIGQWAFKAGIQKQEITDPSNPTFDGLTSLYGQVVSAVKTTAYNIGGAEVEKDLNVFWLGVAYDVTPKLNLAVSYYHIAQNDFSNGTGAANPGDVSGTSTYKSFLVDYRFSKAFDVYLGYMNNELSGGMAAGYLNPSNTVTGLGARYTF